MKKLISKLKEVPDLESKHPWPSQNHSTISNNENFPNALPSTSPNHSHLNAFIGRKFVVGRFTVTVEDIIAEGGFGIVFKTRSQNNQIYALKRLNVNNKRDLKVCKREITIMSSLTHKNILSLVDSQINEHQSGIYELLMLLAYCPNNVAQLMRSKQQMQQHLPENVVIRIVCDVIEAVARLHYCVTPVIHRDLKVENILIDERSNYVLCDFGSATARQIIPTEYGITRTEEEISKYTTLAYRSPEMINLGSQVISCKADVWALGCLLYYLCFFTLPFGDKLLAIQSGKFLIPRSDIEYSSKILKLIRYMLTVDPSERPSVYQIAVLAFSIMNKKSPISNFDRETVPSWDDLPLPQDAQSPQRETLSQSHFVTTKNDPNGESPRSRSRSLAGLQKTVSTSVNPRDRPRGLKVNIGKSDSTSTFPDIPLRSPSLGISQSHSIDLSLSTHKPFQQPKTEIAEINGTETVITSGDAEVSENRPVSSTTYLDPADTYVKQRLGHRRMVSETTSKFVVAEKVKTASSLHELMLQDAEEMSDVSSEVITDSINAKMIFDVENDASFGEEFDKIRHQSGTSGHDEDMQV